MRKISRFPGLREAAALFLVSVAGAMIGKALALLLATAIF